MIDLHTHTNYSDGRASPEELLHYAASIGIKTLAITDHDNANGYRAGRVLAQELGIALIPALELTCRWDATHMPPHNSDIDLLGYFIDPESASFRHTEESSLNDIRSRIAARCQFLAQAGTPVSMDAVVAQNPRYVGTLSLIDTLCALGYATDFKNACSLLDAHRDQVPECSLTIDKAIAAIHAAGGIAVLAHPTLVEWQGAWLDEAAVAQLVEMGLDGIEIYHFRLNNAARAHFIRLARRFHLAISGGSDEHSRPVGFPFLGSQPVTQTILNGLAARHARQARLTA